jgi:acetyl esterase/lipase
MKTRIVSAVVALALFTPAIALPQALTSLASLRVGYTTRKNTVKPQGELKAQIDALDAQIADAQRLGRSAELRRLFAKGNTLLAGRPWTDALDYQFSLVLRTDRVVADSSKPYPARLEQIYAPSLALERSVAAHVVLRKRPTPPAPGTSTPPQPGAIVKDLGTFDGVSRDLRESPFPLELDVRDVADGGYQLAIDVLNGTTEIGTATLNIALRKGLDDTVARLESDAQRAPEAARAELLFPVDRLRNVNRGRLELRTFDPDRDLAAAEAAATAVKAKKDPFGGRTGDFKRHYLLGAAGEIMPYRMYVPAAYNASKPFPLIVALHGLGGTEDSFFDGYESKLPALAEQHGYIVAAPLGYRVDGSYGWGLGTAPADPVTRRVQDLSEQDVMQVLQQVRQHYKIDESRVYLMGHSMGGIGTWKLAAKYPDIWAAIGPISGSGAPATIERFQHIPEIVVHGDNDPTVNVSGSRTMVEKMKALGVEVKYIEVPGGNHGNVVAPNIGAVLDFFDAHKKTARATSQVSTPSGARSADAAKVRVVRDVVYLEGANYADGKDKLDLYLPEGRTNVPVIVSYYGGLLMQGDKREEEYVGHRFAAAGFATAIVNYRLTPAVSHPAHVQDAAASFAWVKRNIARYGGNPDQVFITGHSAGAYLVALLGTDERYLAAHKLSFADVRGVVPVSAFFYVERTGVAPDRDKRVWGTDSSVWVDASPGHHVRKNAPPTLILYADGDEDWRRQQNVEMAQALKAAGAQVEVEKIGPRTHMSIWRKLGEPNDETADRIVRFVQARTGTQGSR